MNKMKETNVYITTAVIVVNLADKKGDKDEKCNVAVSLKP